MRAIQVDEFGGPEVLQVRDLPDPEPGRDQVLVEVEAAEVMFLDIQLRSGWGQEFFGLKPPFVPGAGVAGTVRSVGAEVDPGMIGLRVIAGTSRSGEYVGGGYAELAAVPASETFEVPDVLAPGDALVALHDGVTALSRLERASIAPGERVLVNAAAGSLGGWLVPLARLDGAAVAGAARGERKLERVRELGAEVVVDYSEPGWTRDIQSGFGGNGVDVVFDGAGGKAGNAAMDITESGGRFFSYGAASGDFAEIDREEADSRRIEIIGIDDAGSSLDEPALIHRGLDELKAGRVSPFIGQTFPLERAIEAHARIEDRQAIGKTLLIA